MNNQPLVSVIVPVFMIENDIGRCLQSLINQTYKELEIIAVDDGSVDESGSICDSYAKKDSRIKVIHKKNGGLVAARKTGLKAASGTYIGYVDGDDWVEPEFYQTLVDAMMKSDADMICAGYRRDVLTSSEEVKSAIPNGIYENESLGNLIRNNLIWNEFSNNGISTYLWCKLFKREMLMEYQLGVDERITICEDACVVYPYILNSKKICVIDDCLIHYMQRADSMMHQFMDIGMQLPGIELARQHMIEYSHRHSDSESIEKQIDEYINSTLIVRAGGVRKNGDDILLAFDRKILGKNIAIYGAGTLGRRLAIQLYTLNCCNIVCHVDRNYHHYRNSGLNIDPTEMLSAVNYDYVINTATDRNISRKVEQFLVDNGVDREKIIPVLTRFN